MGTPASPDGLTHRRKTEVRTVKIPRWTEDYAPQHVAQRLEYARNHSGSALAHVGAFPDLGPLRRVPTVLDVVDLVRDQVRGHGFRSSDLRRRRDGLRDDLEGVLHGAGHRPAWVPPGKW